MPTSTGRPAASSRFTSEPTCRSDGCGASASSSSSRRSTPSRRRISVSASRPLVSTAWKASAARWGSRSASRRAPEACTTIALSACATTSCSSPAIRARSSSAAAAARCGAFVPEPLGLLAQRLVEVRPVSDHTADEDRRHHQRADADHVVADRVAALLERGEERHQDDGAGGDGPHRAALEMAADAVHEEECDEERADQVLRVLVAQCRIRAEQRHPDDRGDDREPAPDRHAGGQARDQESDDAAARRALGQQEEDLEQPFDEQHGGQQQIGPVRAHGAQPSEHGRATVASARARSSSCMTIAGSSSRMTPGPPSGSGRIVTAADDRRRGGGESPRP